MPATRPPRPTAAASELHRRDAVLAALTPAARALLGELDLHQRIDSTNAQAMRRIEAGIGSGLVCVAEQQTAGRGRRGKPWISPFASNIYMSLVWRFALQPADLQGLSLAVGVAVTDALASCGVRGLQLKWPNDILYEDAKLGGVLIELVGDSKGGCHVVVGVGLNVCMPVAEAADIDQRWTDIAAISAALPGRDALLAALLNHLLPLMPDFEARGFAPWRERWLQLDAFSGRQVLVHSGAGAIAGVAAGVDACGDLLLQTDTGLQTLVGGEVSLRPAP